MVPRRWHLFPEETAPLSGQETQITDPSIIAISRPFVAPTVDEQIDVELSRLVSLRHTYSNQQEKVTFLSKLRTLVDDQPIDLENLQQPKPSTNHFRSSKKRAPIALEIHEQKCNKKAKTIAGHEALSIWNGDTNHQLSNILAHVERFGTTSTIPQTPIMSDLHLVTDIIPRHTVTRFLILLVMAIVVFVQLHLLCMAQKMNTNT
ncbi:hypothetical protein BX666DRAFT_907307 [Dichotomocladium elegans]|nr:hypothetical protein BX666DRAFT_907307 [Dichotomocladium elegans]